MDTPQEMLKRFVDVLTIAVFNRNKNEAFGIANQLKANNPQFKSIRIDSGQNHITLDCDDVSITLLLNAITFRSGKVDILKAQCTTHLIREVYRKKRSRIY